MPCPALPRRPCSATSAQAQAHSRKRNGRGHKFWSPKAVWKRGKKKGLGAGPCGNGFPAALQHR